MKVVNSYHLLQKFYLQTPIRVDKVFTKNTGVTVNCGCGLASKHEDVAVSVCNSILILYYCCGNVYCFCELLWKKVCLE